MRGAQDGQGEHDDSLVTRRELAGILIFALIFGFCTGDWNVWGV